MNLTILSDSIYRELGSPSELSIPYICYWLRNNCGLLNIALGTNYVVDSTTLEIKQINPLDDVTEIEMGLEEIAIFKLMYFSHYLDTKIRSHYLTYSIRSPIEMVSDGHRIRLTSSSEIGKVFASIKNQVTEDLNHWITRYKLTKSIPRQIVSDDTEEGPGLSLTSYLSSSSLE